MPEARNHHYIPQFYLRGFSSGKKKNRIWTFDLKETKKFPTNIKNIGSIRDFNRIEGEGISPDAIENDLSKLESNFARSLKKFCEERDLNDEQTMNEIYEFMSLLFVRNPYVNENISSSLEHIMKLISQFQIRNKKNVDSFYKELEATRGTKLSGEERKEFEENIKAADFKLNFPNNVFLDLGIKAANDVLPYIKNRKWILFIASEETGPFVTSDRPMCLFWKNPELVRLFYRDNPGIGKENTRIIFPLKSNLSLIGEFNLDSRTIQASKEQVAEINSLIISRTQRQLYSITKKFWFTHGNNLVSGEELLG